MAKNRTQRVQQQPSPEKNHALRDQILLASAAALLSFLGGWGLKAVTSDRVAEQAAERALAESNDRLLQSLAPNVLIRQTGAEWQNDRIRVDVDLTNQGDWTAHSEVLVEATLYGTNLPAKAAWSVDACDAGDLPAKTTIWCPMTLMTSGSFAGVTRVEFKYDVRSTAYKTDESAVIRVLAGSYTEEQIRDRLKAFTYLKNEIVRGAPSSQ